MKRIPKNIKFEDALSELEAQVQLLENGVLPLEESLEVFKYGVELSQICLEKLTMVKQEVEKIIPANDANTYRLETFQDMEAK